MKGVLSWLVFRACRAGTGDFCSALAALVHLLAVLGCFYRMGYTDKKENQIFLIYKEIQSGAVAKSYMREGFLIYVEMRKYFPIYEEADSLCNCFLLNFLICSMRKI
jgi:hypothetical protein